MAAISLVALGACQSDVDGTTPDKTSARPVQMGDTVVIVGHGLAMTAWAVHQFGIEPVAFWTALDFPCVREFAV
jgi:hypothetical protein